jgi:hypothetical protein
MNEYPSRWASIALDITLALGSMSAGAAILYAVWVHVH